MARNGSKGKPQKSVTYETALKLEECGHWEALLSKSDHNAVKKALAKPASWESWFEKFDVAKQESNAKKDDASKVSDSTLLHFRVRSTIFDHLAGLLFPDQASPVFTSVIAERSKPEEPEKPVPASDALDEDYDDGMEDVAEKKGETAAEEGGGKQERESLPGVDVHDMYYTLDDDLEDCALVEKYPGLGIAVARKMRKGCKEEGITPKKKKKTTKSVAGSRELLSLMPDVKTKQWSTGSAVADDMYHAMDTVLQGLIDYKDFSHWFLARVKKSEAPTYYDVITNPMDLTGIGRRMAGLQYSTTAEFMADVQLIFDNCKLFNTDASEPVRKDCAKMEKKAAELAALHLTPFDGVVFSAHGGTMEDATEDMEGGLSAKEEKLVEEAAALDVDELMGHDCDPKTRLWRKATLDARARRASAGQSGVPFEEQAAVDPAEWISLPSLPLAAVDDGEPPTGPSTWEAPAFPANAVTRNIGVLLHARELRDKICDRVDSARNPKGHAVVSKRSDAAWGGLFSMLPEEDDEAIRKRKEGEKRAVAHVGETLAQVMLRQAAVVMVAHAGFDGATQSAVEVLSDVAEAYVARMVRVMRSCLDRAQHARNFPAVVQRTLEEMHVNGVEGLREYVEKDVNQYGDSLRRVRERLSKRYEEALTNPNAILAQEHDFEEHEMAFVTGAFFSGCDLDMLGLQDLLGEEFSYSTFYSLLARDDAAAAAPPAKGSAGVAGQAGEEEASVRFPPPPPFPPIVPAQHIGLLRQVLESHEKEEQEAEDRRKEKAAAAAAAAVVAAEEDDDDEEGEDEDDEVEEDDDDEDDDDDEEEESTPKKGTKRAGEASPLGQPPTKKSRV